MWIIEVEATYSLRLGGEKRVKEVFPGKTTSKQRVEGSVGVKEVGGTTSGGTGTENFTQEEGRARA